MCEFPNSPIEKFTPQEICFTSVTLPEVKDPSGSIDSPCEPSPIQSIIVENLEPSEPLGQTKDLKAKDRIIQVVQYADEYFVGENTWIARALKFISPKVGEEYLHSWQKRALDVAIGLPASFVAIPAMYLLGFVQKLYDGESLFYRATRYKSDLTSVIRVTKLQSLKPGASLLDNDKIFVEKEYSKPPEEDPRVRGFLGKFFRRFEIDEFPQIPEIVRGLQSFVGCRAIDSAHLKLLQNSLPEDIFEEWRLHYCKQKRPSLTGANQVFNKERKIDGRRIHYDNFYVNNASLGLDLYIIWRTLFAILRIKL